MMTINAGSRSAWWYRSRGIDLSTSGVVGTGTGGAANICVIPTSVPAGVMTIYVQKITIVITTLAAQTITFQDTAGSPVLVFVVPASQAVGALTVDFGAKGFALTVGKNLSIAGTAGPAYSYSVEAYGDGPAIMQASTVDRTV